MAKLSPTNQKTTGILMKHIKPYFTGICILIFASILMLTDIFGWFHPDDSLTKGIQFFEQNKYVKAADNFSQAVRLCEHNILAQFYLGATYHQYGWQDEALKQYEKTWELAQNAVRAMHSSARIYLQRGQTEQAVIHFKKALAISPRSPDIWFELGMTFRKTGNQMLARSAFNEALKLDPNNAQLIKAINSK